MGSAARHGADNLVGEAMRLPPFFLRAQRACRSCLVLLVLLLLASCASCYVQPPPVQHHVYYSGSHVTSIAVSETGVLWSSSSLYATDVVHGRIICYNISTGAVMAVWNVTDSPLYSPTSISHLDESAAESRLLYVADSTTRQVLAVDVTTGLRDTLSQSFSIPSQLYESGLVLASSGQGALYIVDRYRGIIAANSLSSPRMNLWVSDSIAPPPGSPLTAAYLSAISTADRAEDTTKDIIFLVDGTGDRVLQMNALGEFMEPLLFALPTEVRGIQAISWTWCTAFELDHEGCLWVMYQADGPSSADRTLIAVRLNNSAVVYNFTTVTAALGTREQEQQTAVNAHLPSPALRVIGSGTSDDPYLLYMAEADPDGPGHVIVVRDETGKLVQTFDPIPPVYDVNNHTMHAFSAVRADRGSCSLWLTDVDNGGMLVQAAADGTILQHFSTAPALFTAVVVDYSASVRSPSLVLLSSNATDWQLWRFYPSNGSFVQLNTTAAHQQTDSQCTATRQSDSSIHSMVDETQVGGLDVDVDSGRLAVSVTCADTLLMLDATKGWEVSFNTTLVHPRLVVFVPRYLHVVAVDRSGEQGQWQFTELDWDSGVTQYTHAFVSPMGEPLALLSDSGSNSLWMSDANGLVFQLDSVYFTVLENGIFQPSPPAYGMTSLSVDADGTLYTVDSVTRRLIMLFVGQVSALRPSAVLCNTASSSSSSSSSSTSPSSSSSSAPSFYVSSSSSTGSGGASGVWGVSPIMLLSAGAVGVAVVVVLVVSLRYYWARRHGSSESRESVGSDEVEDDDEQSAYEQLYDAPDSVSWLPHKAESDMSPYDASAIGKHSAPPVQIVHEPDSRYDAYVRLYEALNEGQSDLRGWHEPAIPRSPSTLLPSRSSHPLPSSVSPASTDSSGSSSGSGSSSDGTQSSSSSAAVPAPPAITRLISRVVPRYVDEVTDMRIVGEGQSGHVYSGMHAGTRVVVKLPKSREMSAAQWREWQAHLRLPAHPSLVRFVGSLVMEDTNYLVLQWVEQGSLASLLNSPTHTTTARWYSRPYGVMRAAADIAAALQHVHQHGLVHRDVSARNVLVDADGTFVLADLGLCQETDTAIGTATCTTTAATATATSPLLRQSSLGPTTVPLRWCSPEYLSSWRATGRLDVWALGVTLWECTASGRKPYSDVLDNTRLQLQLTAGLLALRVDSQWMQQYEGTDERGLVGRVVRLIDTCMTVEAEQRPDAEQLVHVVQQEMAEWEAECGEEAERVKRRWERDHATERRQSSTLPVSAADEAVDDVS